MFKYIYIIILYLQKNIKKIYLKRKKNLFSFFICIMALFASGIYMRLVFFWNERYLYIYNIFC